MTISEPSTGSNPVILADVLAAAHRIRPHVVRTPLERSAYLSDLCGAEVWLKLECFQRSGSFKLRGALNALLSLDDSARQRGVLTASAGNHGLGLAHAAAQTGVAATVVVPATASAAKVEALRQTGVELVLHGADYDTAETFARRLAAERGATFVSPYNHPAVIAGGGTLALEVLEDRPDVELLVVPAGGGGLISGIGVAAKGIQPDIQVVGVQSFASPALHAAFNTGRLIAVPVADSLADGLAGNIEPGSITFDLTRRYVDQVALVEEVDIAHAMRTVLEREHCLVEGSAAVAVAALQGGLLSLARRRVALILTGRNVAASVLRVVLADTTG